jgi:dolichol-phosphate mannosyltransferase
LPSACCIFAVQMKLVIIPTYNERENIVEMIHAVLDQPQGFHLLVVDDGSPDGTAAMVKEKQAEFAGRLHILERSGKLGLGTAYIAGFKWGLKNNYEYIFEMDCDFSHNPKDLPRLLEACEKNLGVAVGSRYVKGGGTVDWPWHRRVISKGGSIYVNLILGLGVKDSTGGFGCYHRDVLSKMNLDGIQFIGYAFQIEMKYKAKRLGFKIAEVPILFADRVKGTSKMSLNIFHEAFFGVLKMRFQKI